MRKEGDAGCWSSAHCGGGHRGARCKTHLPMKRRTPVPCTRLAVVILTRRPRSATLMRPAKVCGTAYAGHGPLSRSGFIPDMAPVCDGKQSNHQHVEGEQSVGKRRLVHYANPGDPHRVPLPPQCPFIHKAKPSKNPSKKHTVLKQIQDLCFVASLECVARERSGVGLCLVPFEERGHSPDKLDEEEVISCQLLEYFHQHLKRENRHGGSGSSSVRCPPASCQQDNQNL